MRPQLKARHRPARQRRSRRSHRHSHADLIADELGEGNLIGRDFQGLTHIVHKSREDHGLVALDRHAVAACYAALSSISFAHRGEIVGINRRESQADACADGGNQPVKIRQSQAGTLLPMGWN